MKSLEKIGFIKLHKDTPKYYYIEDGLQNFEYKGKKYKIQYFSGCFYPYLINIL
jgi:hypothetical protein